LFENFLFPFLSQNRLSLLATEIFCIQSLAFVPPQIPPEEIKKILSFLVPLYKHPYSFSPFTIDLHLTFLHILETHFQEHLQDFSPIIDKLKNYPTQNGNIWFLSDSPYALFSPPNIFYRPGHVFLPFPFDISIPFDTSQKTTCKVMIEHMCEELDKQCNTNNLWKNCTFFFGVRSLTNGIWETQLHKEFPDFSYAITLKTAYAPILLLFLLEKIPQLPNSPKLNEIVHNLINLTVEVGKNDPELQMSLPGAVWGPDKTNIEGFYSK
jgi:hypothetical protein